MAAKDTNDDAKNDDQDSGHSLDMSQAAVKKMIGDAREKGYITYDQLNTVLPPDQVSSEQIEDVMSMLSEMGINIIEDEEAEDEDKGGTDIATTDGPKEIVLGSGTSEKLDRTDDPVRMYLREMGAVELLSREGEIAIAKRIEAGRDMMIMGLCESPITFHAIIQWSEALNNGDMQLREILDLDAMLSKEPPADKMSDDAEEDDDDGEISEATAGPTIREDDEVEDEPEADEDDEDGEGRPKREEEEEEDNTLSLAQMEAALEPEALERFARITKLFKSFEKLQIGRAHV